MSVDPSSRGWNEHRHRLLPPMSNPTDGALDVSGMLRAVPNLVEPTTGHGLELFYYQPGDWAGVQSYDRGLNVWKDLRLNAQNIFLAPQGSGKLVLPASASMTWPNPLDIRPTQFYARDVYADRGDGTGVYYFTPSGSHYLYYDSTQIVCTEQLSLGNHPLVGVSAGGLPGSALAASSVARAALASDARVSELGRYAAGTTFASSSTGVWVLTPATLTVSGNGGAVLVIWSTTIFNTTANVGTYLGIGFDGVVQMYPSYLLNQPAATYFPASGLVYLVPSAGNHTYALYMQTAAGTMGIANNVYTTIDVIQFN